MSKVDWTKWSAVAEILSAVAVVATLLYLALQTQHLAEQTEQNNVLMQAQAGYNMLQNRVGYRADIVRDQDVAEFWYRIRQARSPSDVSDLDIFRWRAERERQMLSWQWEYSQIVAGNLALEEFIVRLPPDGPARDEWERFKSSLSPAFVAWMEDLSFNEDRDATE